MKRVDRSRPWTEEDRVKLLKMKVEDYDWFVIALELGRTQDACKIQYRLIKRHGGTDFSRNE